MDFDIASARAFWECPKTFSQKMKKKECHIWRATPSPQYGDLMQALNLDEYQLQFQFRRPEDRYRFITSRILSRLVLAGYSNISPRSVTVSRSCMLCGDTNHGKPKLAGNDDLRFSISHSGKSVVLAVSDGFEVGIDIEERSISRVESATGVAEMDSDDGRRIANEGQSEECDPLQSWCRMESILKATGHGLAEDPKNLIVKMRNNVPVLRSWISKPDLARRITLLDLDVGYEFCGCLATVDNSDVNVILFDANLLLQEMCATAVLE